MSNHWKTLLLSCCAGALFAGACKKGSSSDNPLPVSYNPSIIISSDNAIVYAIDPVSGLRNWEVSLPGRVFASPLVYGGMVYIATETSDTVYKINSKTGVMVAKINVDPTENGGIKATPVADNGLVYVCNLDGNVYAIDTATNARRWTFDPATVDAAAGGPIISSPVIYKSNLYVATTDGFIFCLDKAQGGTFNIAPFTTTAPVWTINTANVNPSGMPSEFVSSPAVSSPYLYVGSSKNDSNMFCIYLDEVDDPADGIGDIRWVYNAHNYITSSPAIYKGRCIFGCIDFGVYCIDTAFDPLTMTQPLPIWITKTSGRVNSSPFVTSQVVYVGSDDGNLYALNIINGGVKWKFTTGGPILSSPLAYSGSIYVGSYDKKLYCIDSVKGTLKWNYNVNGLIDCSPTIDNLTGEQVNAQVSGYTN